MWPARAKGEEEVDPCRVSLAGCQLRMAKEKGGGNDAALIFPLLADADAAYPSSSVALVFSLPLTRRDGSLIEGSLLSIGLLPPLPPSTQHRFWLLSFHPVTLQLPPPTYFLLFSSRPSVSSAKLFASSYPFCALSPADGWRLFVLPTSSPCLSICLRYWGFMPALIESFSSFFFFRRRLPRGSTPS